MEEFAHRQNIERLEHELEREIDPVRRALFHQLLAEERAQLERILCERARAG